MKTRNTKITHINMNFFCKKECCSDCFSFLQGDQILWETVCETTWQLPLSIHFSITERSKRDFHLLYLGELWIAENIPQYWETSKLYAFTAFCFFYLLLCCPCYPPDGAQENCQMKRARGFCLSKCQRRSSKRSPADSPREVAKGNKRKNRLWTHDKSLGQRENQISRF